MDVVERLYLWGQVVQGMVEGMMGVVVGEMCSAV